MSPSPATPLIMANKEIQTEPLTMNKHETKDESVACESRCQILINHLADSVLSQLGTTVHHVQRHTCRRRNGEIDDGMC
jgi:hypothetical protein